MDLFLLTEGSAGRAPTGLAAVSGGDWVRSRRHVTLLLGRVRILKCASPSQLGLTPHVRLAYKAPDTAGTERASDAERA